jgi:hypothetical protein
MMLDCVVLDCDEAIGGGVVAVACGFVVHAASKEIMATAENAALVRNFIIETHSRRPRPKGARAGR